MSDHSGMKSYKVFMAGVVPVVAKMFLLSRSYLLKYCPKKFECRVFQFSQIWTPYFQILANTLTSPVGYYKIQVNFDPWLYVCKHKIHVQGRKYLQNY